MDKLFPTRIKQIFLTLAVVMLVAVSATPSVQREAAASTCSFTVVTVPGKTLFSALTIGGTDMLEISGNPTVTGSCGGVHTDGDLKIGGTGSFDQDITYSGALIQYDPSIICHGALCPGLIAPVPPPEIDPKPFARLVDYQLRADGKIYQRDISGKWKMIANAKNPKVWNGWTMPKKSSYWTMGEDVTINGSFFVEGDVTISGDPGDPGDRWETTIIATGFIEIAGNPIVEPNPANAPELQGILFIAGTDLKINGNPDQEFAGILAAHEQIDISGAPNFNGCIIAENAASNGEAVKDNKVGGDMFLSCNDCAWPRVEMVVDILEPF